MLVAPVEARRVLARRRGKQVRGMDKCKLAAWNARSVLRCLQIRREGVTDVGHYDKVSWISQRMKLDGLVILCLSEHHLADSSERAEEAYNGGVNEQDLGGGHRLLLTKHAGVVFSPETYECWVDAGSKNSKT